MPSETNQPSDLKAILDLKWQLDNCAPELRPQLWRRYLEEIKAAAG
jgi:hypothetical protein